MASSVLASAEPTWVAAEKDYELALIDGKLVCRNPKGKQLASVPKWLKDSELAQQLSTVNEWLARHEAECRESVELWMMRSLPVPREILAAVWDDPTWRTLLENLVVCAVDKQELNQEESGFLKDIDKKKGVGVIDLDGESQWITTPSVAIPHPILLTDLADYRELIVELNFEQPLDQLFRQTCEPTDEQQELSRIEQFQNAKFEQLNHALGLCRRLGYRVRGGSATCAVWEQGRLTEARYWIGGEYPESETWTGDLVFTDERERSVPIKEVGPVAFSEGMRMAAAIYAKRVVEDDNDDD